MEEYLSFVWITSHHPSLVCAYQTLGRYFLINFPTMGDYCYSLCNIQILCSTAKHNRNRTHAVEENINMLTSHNLPVMLSSQLYLNVKFSEIPHVLQCFAVGSRLNQIIWWEHSAELCNIVMTGQTQPFKDVHRETVCRTSLLRLLRGETGLERVRQWKTYW